MMRRLDAMSDGLNRTLRPAGGGPPTVRWMERSRPRARASALSAVPLDLAPVLRELLFDRLDTVVLTSATLAAGGEFDFLESRLGLSGEGSPVTVREIFRFAVRLSVPVRVRGSQRPARAPRGRAGPRRRRGAGRHRPGLRLRRRDVRAVHQPCGAAAGGAGAAGRCWATGGRILVQGESPAGRAAPPVPRGGERHSAGHRFVLGRRRCAGPRAPHPGAQQTTFQGARRSRSPRRGSSAWRKRGWTAS